MVLVLGALIALGPATIDMYLPALPTHRRRPGGHAGAVQLTLTGTLVGLGARASSCSARCPTPSAGACRCSSASPCTCWRRCCAWSRRTSPSSAALRLLQGLAAAAAAVVATAVVRDLYSGNAAAVVLSRLMLVLGAAPVLAPTVGGELLRLTDWRGVFGALAVLGALLLLMAARRAARDAAAVAPPHRRGRSAPLRAYRGLLRDRTYVGLVLVAGTAMAALFAYVSGSSFVLQEQYGLAEQQFGLVFGAGAVFLIARHAAQRAAARPHRPPRRC